MLTYADRLANIDLRKLLALQPTRGKLTTITAERPSGRFRALACDEDRKGVAHFEENP